ncbi:hypothetical protein GCM10009630_12660 [Kribbella jejuensis]|uniref:lysine N(6)-hydroxylase/L-ornithine N(5)-oxygenase family protein n=1 Tax=Kribbella jejuensis TaxID=236068 RepID=UPI001EE33037|nr:lysine N(6)-hydroxylase/L-ornithine N(5)-oxygenase family protein [Kribbella jejuensis]
MIDASGTSRKPNVLGDSGIPARNELAADGVAHALADVFGTDRGRYAGRPTAVIGAGHSAATTLLDLGRSPMRNPGTEIVWVVRGTNWPAPTEAVTPRKGRPSARSAHG